MHWSIAPSRTLLSVLLSLVAALSVTLAVVQWWVAHAVFDEDRFAGIAMEVVEREDVRAELRRVIVDQIILQQPDLVATRPIIETVVDTALVSPAVRPIIEQAARGLHEVLFESDQRSIVFNVSDIMTLATAGVRAYDADLADRIPGGGTVGAITITERNAGTRIVEIDRDLTALRWVFIAGALVSFAAALMIAPTRYMVLLYTGVGLVGLAIVVWLAIGVIEGVVRDSVRGNPLAAEAAAAVWNLYAAGLVWWMWLQALTGIALATVATSAVSDVSVGQRARHGFSFVSDWWNRRAVRVVLASLLAVLGLMLMVAPMSTARVLVQAGGLGLLYAGGYELFRALGLARSMEPRAPRQPRPAPTGAPLHVTASAALAGFALFAGALSFVTVFWLNRDSLSAPPASASPPVDRCNGSAEACDRPLNGVVLAGTHNSMAAADQRGWYFANHRHGIPDQLADGVRLLLVDLYYGYATNNGVRTDPEIGSVAERLEPSLGPAAVAAASNLINRIGPIPADAQPSLYLCHGFCELGATSFDATLVDIRQFLDDNPNQVLVMFLQDYVDPFDVEDAFIRAGAFDYVYTLVPGEPMPTLRDMISVDRRIVVLSENHPGDAAPPWYHDAFALTQDTPYAFSFADELTCDVNRGPGDAPFFLMNHWLTRSSPSPRHAEVLNDFEFLYDRVEACREERGVTPNFIAVNFYETGDLFEVVETLNSEIAAETAADQADDEASDDDGAGVDNDADEQRIPTAAGQDE